MTARQPDLPAGRERLTLRPAVLEDAAMIFAWRNLPSIVEVASQKGAIAWEGHQRWFAESIRGNERSIFVILCEGVPAGQIRFDWVGSGEAHVSLYLVPPFTGRGLGVRAIRQGCGGISKTDRAILIVAWVRADNARSLAAFRKAGFTAVEADPPREGLVRMEFEQPVAVPHNRLTFGAAEEQAVARVVRSGRWVGGGVLAEVESGFAREAGVAHAIGVGSGLGALRLSLLALGIGPGDAVAVPAYSCVALPNAVLACGAEPVPVDVEPDTWNISVPATQDMRLRRPDLKAVIAVHTFGCPAPIRELESLGLPVVEDCSHAFGQAPLGSLGRIAVLSLYASKLLAAGEGGMVLTVDPALAEKIRAARDYTDRAPAAGRLNDKLTDLEAALARCQLERLPDLLARREALARRYTSELSAGAADGFYALPVERTERVWYRYAVAVRDARVVVDEMAAHGVVAAIPVENWCPTADAPVNVAAHREIVSLPLYPTLSEREQDRVVAAFLAAVSDGVRNFRPQESALAT